jgi:hypothetical protein
MRYKYHTIEIYVSLKGQPVRAPLRACQSCPRARQLSAQTIRGNFSLCPILFEVRAAASQPYDSAHPAMSPNLVSVRSNLHDDSWSELTCHPNPLASSLAPASASPWKNRSRDPSLKLNPLSPQPVASPTASRLINNRGQVRGTLSTSDANGCTCSKIRLGHQSRALEKVIQTSRKRTFSDVPTTISRSHFGRSYRSRTIQLIYVESS